MASPGKPRGTTCARARAKACAATMFTRPPGAIDARPACAANSDRGKLAALGLGMSRAERRASPELCPMSATTPDANAACLSSACRCAGHEAALPPQAAPSPTLPRQARTMKNCLALSQAFRVSTPLSASSSEHHSGMHAPHRDGPSIPRHLSLLLRSPWTAFSFLA